MASPRPLWQQLIIPVVLLAVLVAWGGKAMLAPAAPPKMYTLQCERADSNFQIKTRHGAVGELMRGLDRGVVQLDNGYWYVIPGDTACKWKDEK